MIFSRFKLKKSASTIAFIFLFQIAFSPIASVLGVYADNLIEPSNESNLDVEFSLDHNENVTEDLWLDHQGLKRIYDLLKVIEKDQIDPYLNQIDQKLDRITGIETHLNYLIEKKVNFQFDLNQFNSSASSNTSFSEKDEVSYKELIQLLENKVILNEKFLNYLFVLKQVDLFLETYNYEDFLSQSRFKNDQELLLIRELKEKGIEVHMPLELELRLENQLTQFWLTYFNQLSKLRGHIQTYLSQDLTTYEFQLLQKKEILDAVKKLYVNRLDESLKPNEKELYIYLLEDFNFISEATLDEVSGSIDELIRLVVNDSFLTHFQGRDRYILLLNSIGDQLNDQEIFSVDSSKLDEMYILLKDLNFFAEASFIEIPYQVLRSFSKLEKTIFMFNSSKNDTHFSSGLDLLNDLNEHFKLQIREQEFLLESQKSDPIDPPEDSSSVEFPGNDIVADDSNLNDLTSSDSTESVDLNPSEENLNLTDDLNDSDLTLIDNVSPDPIEKAADNSDISSSESSTDSVDAILETQIDESTQVLEADADLNASIDSSEPGVRSDSDLEVKSEEEVNRSDIESENSLSSEELQEDKVVENNSDLASESSEKSSALVDDKNTEVPEELEGQPDDLNSSEVVTNEKSDETPSSIPSENKEVEKTNEPSDSASELPDEKMENELLDSNKNSEEVESSLANSASVEPDEESVPVESNVDEIDQDDSEQPVDSGSYKADESSPDLDSNNQPLNDESVLSDEPLNASTEEDDPDQNQTFDDSIEIVDKENSELSNEIVEFLEGDSEALRRAEEIRFLIKSDLNYLRYNSIKKGVLSHRDFVLLTREFLDLSDLPKDWVDRYHEKLLTTNDLDIWYSFLEWFIFKSSNDSTALINELTVSTLRYDENCFSSIPSKSVIQSAYDSDFVLNINYFNPGDLSPRFCIEDSIDQTTRNFVGYPESKKMTLDQISLNLSDLKLQFGNPEKPEVNFNVQGQSYGFSLVDRSLVENSSEDSNYEVSVIQSVDHESKDLKTSLLSEDSGVVFEKKDQSFLWFNQLNYFENRVHPYSMSHYMLWQNDSNKNAFSLNLTNAIFKKVSEGSIEVYVNNELSNPALRLSGFALTSKMNDVSDLLKLEIDEVNPSVLHFEIPEALHKDALALFFETLVVDSSLSLYDFSESISEIDRFEFDSAQQKWFDLNQDGFSDLIVSNPLAADRRGEVEIFLSQDQDIVSNRSQFLDGSIEPSVVINGPSLGGLFGSDFQFLKTELDEGILFISSPNNGSGVIYGFPFKDLQGESERVSGLSARISLKNSGYDHFGYRFYFKDINQDNLDDLIVLTQNESSSQLVTAYQKTDSSFDLSRPDQVIDLGEFFVPQILFFDFNSNNQNDLIVLKNPLDWSDKVQNSVVDFFIDFSSLKGALEPDQSLSAPDQFRLLDVEYAKEFSGQLLTIGAYNNSLNEGLILGLSSDGLTLHSSFKTLFSSGKYPLLGFDLMAKDENEDTQLDIVSMIPNAEYQPDLKLTFLSDLIASSSSGDIIFNPNQPDSDSSDVGSDLILDSNNDSLLTEGNLLDDVENSSPSEVIIDQSTPENPVIVCAGVEEGVYTDIESTVCSWNNTNGPSEGKQKYCIDTENQCNPAINSSEGEVTIIGLNEHRHYLRVQNVDEGGESEIVSFSLAIDRAPIFTELPSDGGVGIDNPLVNGDRVQFSARAFDIDEDPFQFLVCRTSEKPIFLNGSFSCSSKENEICSIGPLENESRILCESPVQLEQESEIEWHAFVCQLYSDNPICTESNQGEGINGSPFYVNRSASFAGVAINSVNQDQVYPGERLEFSIDSNQLFNIAPNSKLTLHVCSSVSSGYDLQNNNCIGGEFICSNSDTFDSNISLNCSEKDSLLVPLGSESESRAVKVYVSLNDKELLQGNSDYGFEIEDLAPEIIEYKNQGNLLIEPGKSQEISFSGKIRDLNGWHSLKEVNGVFYNADQVDENCKNSSLNCYTDIACEFKDLNVTDTEVLCRVEVFYNANASSNWKVHLKPVLSTVEINDLPSSSESRQVPPLMAINQSVINIPYSGVVPGEVSEVSKVDLINLGNQSADLLLFGTDLVGKEYRISHKAQKWNFNPQFDYQSEGNELVKEAVKNSNFTEGCLNLDLPPQSDPLNPISVAMFWKIKVPESIQADSYRGSVSFEPVNDQLCK